MRGRLRETAVDPLFWGLSLSGATFGLFRSPSWASCGPSASLMPDVLAVRVSPTLAVPDIVGLPVTGLSGLGRRLSRGSCSLCRSVR